MMFSEFQANTGCRDNEANHILFRRLELIYMQDEQITKEEIYDMGRKLMDNTPTQAEIELRERITAEIESRKMTIAAYRNEIKYHEDMRDLWKDSDKEYARIQSKDIRNLKDLIRQERQIIAGLKWVIE